MVAPSHSGTWSQVRVRTRLSKNIRVEFRFYPDYARTVWIQQQRRTPAFVTRGERRPASETLLLDDVMFIDNQSAFARAWLIPASTPEYYHLRVELAAPQQLVRNARVSLRWDKHEYLGIMRAGQLFFENISPPDFSRFLNNLPTRRLHLAFEFENDPKAGHGKVNGNGHKNGNGNGKH